LYTTFSKFLFLKDSQTSGAFDKNFINSIFNVLMRLLTETILNFKDFWRDKIVSPAKNKFL